MPRRDNGAASSQGGSGKVLALAWLAACLTASAPSPHPHPTALLPVYSIDERSAIRKSHENPSIQRLYKVGSLEAG